MTNELMSLTWVITLSAVMWVPYIVNTIMVQGLKDAVGYPDNPKPLAPWAQRMKKAHYNAVENLVMFAALVLMLNALGISNATTVSWPAISISGRAWLTTSSIRPVSRGCAPCRLPSRGSASWHCCCSYSEPKPPPPGVSMTSMSPDSSDVSSLPRSSSTSPPARTM